MVNLVQIAAALMHIDHRDVIDDHHGEQLPAEISPRLDADRVIFLLCAGYDAFQSFGHMKKLVGLTLISLNRHDIVPFVLKLPPELVDAAAGDQLSLDEDADPVADLLDLIELMGGQEDRASVLYGQLLDQSRQLAHSFGINPQRRLVHDDDLRILHQDIGNPEPLSHAAGVAAGLASGRVCHTDTLQQTLRPRFALLPCKTVDFSSKDKIFKARHIRIEADVVREIADDPLHADRISRAVRPGDVRLTRGRLREAQEHQRRRGLARAVRPQQSVDFAFADLQVQTVHRRDAAVLLRQIDGTDDGFRHRSVPPEFADDEDKAAGHGGDQDDADGAPSGGGLHGDAECGRAVSLIVRGLQIQLIVAGKRV